MKLYLTPGACSLADHIALREAGMDPAIVRVEIPTHRTEAGDDYTSVNPKGYVPALELDDGQVLTENVAILDWVASRAPELQPSGELGRSRLVEMLSFIATEIHRAFMRLFFSPAKEEQRAAGAAIAGRLSFLGARLQGDYLFGSRFSAADAFLYVMIRWAKSAQLPVPAALVELSARIEARPRVQDALKIEGLA